MIQPADQNAILQLTLRCASGWLGSGVFARPQHVTSKDVELKKLGAGEDARPQPRRCNTVSKQGLDEVSTGTGSNWR